MTEGNQRDGRRYGIIAVCGLLVLAAVFGACRLGAGSARSADVGQEAAKSAALNHAGVAENLLSRYEIAREERNGAPVYQVNFMAEGTAYAYEISAADGSIVKFSREADSVPAPPPAEPEETVPAPADSPVDEARAWEIAYAHAGVAAADAAPSPAKLDDEDGILVYELEFFSGGYEYDYEIRASDGCIVKFEREPDPKSAPPQEPAGTAADASAQISAAPADPPDDPAGAAQSAQGTLTADAVSYIGEARAREIAYGHACLTADDITRCGVELDHHGSSHHGGHGSHHGSGCCAYEVDFTSGGYEYEYKIDAVTGEILGFEQEMHH